MEKLHLPRLILTEGLEGRSRDLAAELTAELGTCWVIFRSVGVTQRCLVNHVDARARESELDAELLREADDVREEPVLLSELHRPVGGL